MPDLKSLTTKQLWIEIERSVIDHREGNGAWKETAQRTLDAAAELKRRDTQRLAQRRVIREAIDKLETLAPGLSSHSDSNAVGDVIELLESVNDD